MTQAMEHQREKTKLYFRFSRQRPQDSQNIRNSLVFGHGATTNPPLEGRSWAGPDKYQNPVRMIPVITALA